MSQADEIVTASVVQIETIQVGNGRCFFLLTLDVPYALALRFSKIALRKIAANGCITEVPGILEFAHPLDAPACIGVDQGEMGTVANVDRVCLIP